MVITNSRNETPPVDVDSYIVRLDRDVLVAMWLGEFRINLNRIKTIRELTKSEELIFKLRNNL